MKMSWNKEDRALVRSLIHDSDRLFALLDDRPELLPFYREMGNNHLRTLVNRLIRYHITTCEMYDKGEVKATDAKELRKALEYGANPYFPKNIMHKIAKRGSLCMLTTMVEMGLDPKDCVNDQTSLVWYFSQKPKMVRIFLDHEVPWTKQCTNYITECYNIEILEMLCRTGRIYTIENLLFCIIHYSHHRLTLPYLLKIIECNVVMPYKWLVDPAYNLKKTITEIIPYGFGHRTNGYVRACWLVEQFTEVKALREQLVCYLLPFPAQRYA